VIRAVAVPDSAVLNTPRYTPPRNQIVSPGRTGLLDDNTDTKSNGRTTVPSPDPEPTGDTTQPGVPLTCARPRP